MWQLYAMAAQDLLREREREARAVRLARDAAAFASEERRRHPSLGPAPVGAARRALARALRAVEMAAGSLSRAARATAARVEGRASS